MAQYRWSEQKNRLLQEQRGIGFPQIVIAIENGGLLDDLPHPNHTRYPNQSIMVVAYGEYAHLVPYLIEDQEQIFLKTVIPSRKATKDYLRRPNKEEDLDNE